MEGKETCIRKRKIKDVDNNSEEPIAKKKVSLKVVKSLNSKSVPSKKATVKDNKESIKNKKIKQEHIKKVEDFYNLNNPDTEYKDIAQNDLYSNNWNEAEMLAYFEKVTPSLAQKFISLLSDGCTLPFIARYRKEAVEHLMPDRYANVFNLSLSKNNINNDPNPIKYNTYF